MNWICDGIEVGVFTRSRRRPDVLRSTWMAACTATPGRIVALLLAAGMFVGMSTSARAQAWDVEVLSGTGLNNVAVGPVHSATGTPATIGSDELINSLNAIGFAELNTGTGGPGPGNIFSSDISISGVYTFSPPGVLTLDADNNINLGLGGILLSATGVDAPGITLNAPGDIVLDGLKSTSDTGLGGSIILNVNGDIVTSGIDARSVTGNGGSLTIVDPSGNGTYDLGQVYTGSDALTTNQNSGNGGAITIGTVDAENFHSLSFIELNSASIGDAQAGNGGNVEVYVDGDPVLGNGNVITSSSANGDAGNGGRVNFRDRDYVTSLTLATIDTHSESLSGAAGNGGNVNLDDFGEMDIANIDTSVISPNGSGGDAGLVTLRSNASGPQTLSLGTISANAETATGGNGSAVELRCDNGSITVAGGIDTSATAGDGGSIRINVRSALSLGSSVLNSSGTLNGAMIRINDISLFSGQVTGNGLITTGRTVGAGLSLGNSGDVFIKGESVTLGTISTAQSAGVDVGTIGSITLQSTIGDIAANRLDASVTSGGVNNGAGSLFIDSAAGISIADIDTTNTAGAVDGTPDGGSVTLTSATGVITIDTITTTATMGTGGTVTFQVDDLSFTPAPDSIDRGDGLAVLRTIDATRPVIVGSAPAPSATDLVLDDSIFDAFAAATGALNIGELGRTATITVASDFIKKSPVAFQQPTMVAAGSHTGNITFADRFDPEAGPAVVDFTDSLTLEPSATLFIELGGVVPGTEFDQITVGGAANLAGTLDLSYINTFNASPGDTFVIIAAGTLNGAFDTINLPGEQPLSVDYDYSAGTVTVALCLADVDGDGVCESPVGVDWDITAGGAASGTMCNTSVSVTPVFDGPPSTNDLSGPGYSGAPLSAVQELLGYAAPTDWTATFDPPVSGLLLYATFWRGAGALGPDPTSYTFDQPFTILSGFSGASVVGATLLAPHDQFHSGILMFTEPVTTLSVTSNAESTGAGQLMTFGVLNGCDVCVGFDDTTDTDLDGVPDGCDLCSGFDDSFDCNTNGIPDGCDLAERAVLENFEGGGGSGNTLNGTAVVEAGSVRLTEAVPSQLGSVIFEPLTDAPVDSFRVSFDYFMGGGNGADGMSFALIDADVTGDGVLLGEGGGNQPISLSLDTFLTNPGDGNHAVLRSHGTILANTLVAAPLDDGQWQRADLIFDGGQATLLLTTATGNVSTIFEDIPVPTYTPVRGRFGFGARTGAVNNEHRVDNVWFAITSLTNDCDANLVPDDCDPDDDGDGVPNACDACPGFDDFADADGDGLPDGCDACPNRATGDIDSDGLVDANDAPMFVSLLLDSSSASDDEFCAADVNQDGAVDGLDIQRMIDLMLSP